MHSEGPGYFPVVQAHISVVATLSYTSNGPQKDVCNYVGLVYIGELIVPTLKLQRPSGLLGAVVRFGLWVGPYLDSNSM